MMEELIDVAAPIIHEHPTREKIRSLQILRGLAASFVVVHHVSLAHSNYGGESSWIVRSGLGTLGACGVDLFFVISGFIMMYTSGDERGWRAAKVFFVRRGRRILPLYWTWTTFLLLLWKAKLIFAHSQYRAIYIASSYVLWPLQNGGTFHPVLDPGWTLTLELFFYVVFGLVIALNSRLSLGLLVIAAFIASNLLGHLSAPSSSLRYLLTNNLLAEFCLGIVAAYLVRTISAGRLIDHPRQWFVGVLITCGIAALLLSAHFGQPEQWRFVIWGLPCFCLLLGTVLLQLQTTHSLFVYLGDASYSIYLGHFLLVVGYATAVKKHLLPDWLSADAGILVFSAAIIAVSSLGYRLLEKPELSWVNYRARFNQRFLSAPRALRSR